MSAHGSNSLKERLLFREHPKMVLRVELGAGGRGGLDLPAWVTVEWAGRLGHPSSYGLPGGYGAEAIALHVSPSDPKFTKSLAGRFDDVRWGLPLEYQSAVLGILKEQPNPVVVSRAAHGALGSSRFVFRGVALLLCRILRGGLPSKDSAAWDLFDACRKDAHRSAG